MSLFREAPKLDFDSDSRNKIEISKFEDQPVYTSPGTGEVYVPPKAQRPYPNYPFYPNYPSEIQPRVPKKDEAVEGKNLTLEDLINAGKYVLNSVTELANNTNREKFVAYLKSIKSKGEDKYKEAQELIKDKIKKDQAEAAEILNRAKKSQPVTRNVVPVSVDQIEKAGNIDLNSIIGSVIITEPRINISILTPDDINKTKKAVSELLERDVTNIPIPNNEVGQIANRVKDLVIELPEKEKQKINDQVFEVMTGVISEAVQTTKTIEKEISKLDPERLKAFQEAAKETIQKHLGLAISGLTIALMIIGSSYLQSSAREVPQKPTVERMRVAPQETPFAGNFEPTPTAVPVSKSVETAEVKEKKAVLVKSSDQNPINQPFFLNSEQAKSFTGGETIGMILGKNSQGNGVYVVENKNKLGPSLAEIESKIGEKFVMVVSLKPEFENGREEHLDLTDFVTKNEDGNFVLDPSQLPQETLKLISDRSSNDGLSYGFIDEQNYYRAGSTRDLEDFQQVTKIETGAF